MARKKFVAKPYQEILQDHFVNVDRPAGWAGMGMGKLQPVSEPVATPTGWIQIGHLRVGDLVIGANGKPTKVTGVFPNGVQHQYRISFNDGSWTRAGGDHLWAVATPRNREQYKVLTTKQILKAGLTYANGNRKWSIPMVEPVQYDESVLPVEPYLLGVLLGDGTLPKNSAPTITSDKEILINWRGRRETHPSAGIEFLALSNQKELLNAVTMLGLRGKRSWEKFVPRCYLFASVAQRLALLQGLLDTDGYAMGSGGVEFSSTSVELARNVVELTQSLGGVARMSAGRFTKHQGGVGRESWRVNVKLPNQFVPFRLKRKLDRWVEPTKYPPRRVMTDIAPWGVEDSVCISVAAGDQLYVTRSYIVTHNTVSTLNAIDRLHLMGEDHPTLVLAPLLVAKTTWPEEARKWDNLRHIRVVPVVGSEAERIRALNVDASIYTTNYENIPWLVEYLGARWPFKHVVADESTRLKSFRLRQGGKRAQALARVAHTKIKRFIELTGTPSPNGLLDLWGQIWMLDAGQRLGRSYSAFRDRWFSADYDGYSYKPFAHSSDEIHNKLRDICLTVNAKDWFDLRDPIVTNKYVELNVRGRKLYDDMERQFFLELEGHEVEAVHAASRSQKLLQLSNGAIYVDPLVESDEEPRARLFKEVHDAKIQALDSIVTEAAGAPVLVAYNFKSDLARLQKAFPKAKVLDPRDVTTTMRAWNDGKIEILLVHPASAGHGLNLQDGGNILVFFGLNWNLEQRLQVIERIGPTRQMQAGHDRPVFIYNIIAKDTIDELVLARVETKREVQDILLEAMARRK